MNKGVRTLFLLAALAAGPVVAAPDEAALGKNENYPVCPLAEGLRETRCLVGQYSHLDEITTSTRIARGSSTHELKSSGTEPDLGADAFMAQNRNTGLLVLRGDRILAERYQYGRKASDRMTSWSMAKTVVAMLIGVALQDRLIQSIDDRAEKYLPDLEGHPYGDTALKDLLTMSSGVKFLETDESPDIGRLVAATIYKQGPGGLDTITQFDERPRAAGTRFNYASADTQVLGLVLRAATGKSLGDYLSEKLWQPMGAAADATWMVDASGQELAYCCINATLRDWGRIGLLLANGGSMDGRQVIPADWVRSMTTVHAPHLKIGTATTHNGYGYQTWLIDNDGRFALFGIRGQAVFVDPKTKLVIVHTAVHEYGDNDSRGRQFKFFYETLRRLAL